ncbi:MAG: cupin domain-containing protein [Deltaproteobacteria bacterium]|nr:cupin domain-containing protein [Candidatus Zymogenaceae bacterium]
MGGIDMFIRNISDIENITAEDKSVLKEVLSPLKDRIDVGYSLAYAVVGPGRETLPHRLKTLSEVFIIIEGVGIISIEHEERPVTPGTVVHVPPGKLQYLKNTGEKDLVFYCIVDPPWKMEEEVVVV